MSNRKLASKQLLKEKYDDGMLSWMYDVSEENLYSLKRLKYILMYATPKK